MIRWRNRGNKYGAVKTVVDGITFDSKAEARRYQELILLEKAGKVTIARIHPQFPVFVKGLPICKVILDFEYYDIGLGICVVEDVKGKDNALSRLKRKLVEACYDIKVDVISASSRAGKKNDGLRSPRGRRGSPKPDSI